MSDYLDRYGRARSVCHRLPASAKLLVTLAAIGVGMFIPPSHWPAHGSLLCVLFGATALAGIPFRYVARRVAGFLVLAILFGIGVPLSQGFRGGWEIMAGIVFRGTESFLAGLWLVNVIPFDQLLAALRRWGTPAILLAILAFMYRFVFVLWDELNKMRTARSARTFARGSALFRWKNAAHLIGMLLIRALGAPNGFTGPCAPAAGTANCGRWTNERFPPDIVLEVKGLSYAYPNGQRALSDVNFSLSRGEIVGIVGPSGAGKSTLLLHLNGLLPERTPRARPSSNGSADPRGGFFRRRANTWRKFAAWWDSCSRIRTTSFFVPRFERTSPSGRSTWDCRGATSSAAWPRAWPPSLWKGTSGAARCN